ncbi:hypothetical protein [Actinoplanes sp. NPDC051859]|uniref:hypothetical protein n=1 Tax=Actinoplanes sp. NPDC051859 TaxID=3363909 RepID=UPI0037B73F63
MSPRLAGAVALLAALGLTAACTPHTPAGTPTSSPPVVAGFATPDATAVTAALRTADAYVRAWARPDLDSARWLAGVAPYTAPRYRALLSTVDPRHIPARTVTGPPTTVRTEPTVIVADVPTDAGAVRVSCEPVDGRWLVTTVEPVASPR